jgi:hypothetical protein
MVFFLLFLICSPILAMAEGESHVKIIKADGAVKSKLETIVDSSYTPNNIIENRSIIQSKETTVVSNNGTKNDGILESSIKAAQTAFENALDGFTHKIIDQLVEGSVSLYATEAEKSNDGTITYKIRYKVIDPFEPNFVVMVLKYTLGFLICLIFFVIIGSNLMLLIQERYPEWFSESRESLTGEDSLYTASTARMATFGSIFTILFAFAVIFIITGFRNLIVYAITPDGVIIPNLSTDSIPNGFLAGLSSYSSAFESHIGLYGIYIFAASICIFCMICSVLWMLGALDIVVQLAKFFFGAYAFFNFIDIINMCCISAGIYVYIDTGDDFFVTVGICFGAVVVVIITYLLYLQLKRIVTSRS